MVFDNNEGPQTTRPTPVDPGTELAHAAAVDKVTVQYAHPVPPDRRCEDCAHSVVQRSRELYGHELACRFGIIINELGQPFVSCWEQRADPYPISGCGVEGVHFQRRGSVTAGQADITCAAYALNLLHGAELASFEVENLIALAAKAGAKVSPEHLKMAQARDAKAAAIKAKLEERESLRETISKCRDQFRRYQHLHALKPDGSGQEKAKVNGEFADMCDAALKGGA